KTASWKYGTDWSKTTYQKLHFSVSSPRKAIMSPVSKAEVSLSSENDVRMNGYGMGDDERARAEPRGGFGAG
ncbi:hypothetical protein, partial [Sulfitobacter mediterraneus]|uniref:hypothetical protein n=1 Tax=Sulfitobacter mediterraneus TaxID=83219 RepID=UPI001EEE5E68